ncbi:DUF2141 domain-containing protein [Flavobacteriaceae bacterium TP-CH-4]|uniref:DUF2141 domain-containing protein n=1 Tax=Pelagihabitans pacificus TaxID=2696054 RepID=A0A967AZP8_9FLAO|nr:DUF2141 domain-containing protein [Pelagihabitans pacificus]NHF59486.1 DUF2141 domain-containing protein [Pelagihabitans pacificus]
MKKLGILAVAFLFLSLTSSAQEETGNTITVIVENVLSDGGTILAGLHTEDTFMKNGGIANASSPAKAGEVVLTFENVQPGTYAIMVMHDANDNMRMDMEVNGMPKESYGMSGNAMTMGPPTFADAKFELTDEDQEFRIRF